jgi:ribosomal protein S27E
MTASVDGEDTTGASLVVTVVCPSCMHHHPACFQKAAELVCCIVKSSSVLEPTNLCPILRTILILTVDPARQKGAAP